MFRRPGIRFAVAMFAIAFVALIAPSARAAEFVLAKNGKPAAPIVISANASDEIKQTAKELAGFLQRMTGAEFLIMTGNGSKGIVLGTLEEFPQPDLKKPLEIRARYDGKEAFALRSSKQRLLILGATPHGTSHGVYRLLDKLGCRWFFPAPEWEVIPEAKNLSVDIDVTERPALLARRIWYGYAFFDRNKKKPREEYNQWVKHNLQGASLKIYAGHAWQNIILSNKKAFEEHPEYRALVKGKREGWQLCVSNPAVRKLAVDWAMDYLDRNPTADMVSMDTSDGNGQCECELCKRMGSISDRAFGLANEVARHVDKKYKGKMVGILAYNEHCEPPTFPLEPNVYVQLTAGFIRGKYTFNELKELWPKKCKNMGFYEYFSVWPWDWDMPPGGRAANIPMIRDRIKDYVAHSATSLDCESSNNWGVHGLGYYVAAKLMWNPEADIEALKEDFFTRAFGPAAPAMRRYYDRFDTSKEVLVSEHLLGMALRDLQEAGKLAHDRPDVLARVDQLKQYQHYVRLKWEFDHNRKDLDLRKKLAADILTHGSRTRYSYMNHWAAMYFSWSNKLAKDLKDDSLSWRNKEAVWKVDEPLSSAETADHFASDLQRFQPQKFTTRTFTKELVPSGLTSKKPAVSVQRFQSPGKYALYSVKGEPLTGKIKTGLISWYRDRPNARLTITDQAGKSIHEQSMVLDGEDHAFKVKVPAPGLYWLEFNDSGAAWSLEVDAGRPAVFELSLKRRIHSLGQMPRMYFYVPPGTKEVSYFYEGIPHDVVGPDGKVITRITDNGKYVTIPVPPGSDGQAWALRYINLGTLWFTNCPNYLAASPEALLIPSETLAK